MTIPPNEAPKNEGSRGWSNPSPQCSGHSQINVENRVECASEAEVETSGYQRTGNCR
jgi:hypothetical protein